MREGMPTAVIGATIEGAIGRIAQQVADYYGAKCAIPHLPKALRCEAPGSASGEQRARAHTRGLLSPIIATALEGDALG